jgi:5-methylcytosine-specific restriction protein A
MPLKAKRPCPRPGCPALIAGSAHACPEHSRERERDRGSARARGYDTLWQRARLAYLAEHPLCTRCERHGLTAPARVVDHIIPHRGARALFDDAANRQSLCGPCHNAKTARERGACPCARHGAYTASIQDLHICLDCGGQVEPVKTHARHEAIQ